MPPFDNSTPTNTAADRLFYDGSCPLCRHEMDQLRRRCGSTLRLVDIHSLADAVSDTSLEALPARAEMLQVLHLQTAQGEWVKGLDANVRAWQHTQFGWLWRPLRWPLVASVADWLYAIWAKARYAKRYGSVCEPCRSSLSK